MNETNTTKNYKSGIIFLLAIACFFILLKALPFAPKENAGLALLAFVAILWLTEALHVTVTALLVPLLAIALDLVTTKQALVAFADPTIFLFFGGFALATALHMQKLDKMIAEKMGFKDVFAVSGQTYTRKLDSVFANVLGGSLVVETIFSVPGMGGMMVDSINANDHMLTVAILVFYSMISLITVLIVDISYGIIDPRVRMGGKK